MNLPRTSPVPDVRTRLLTAADQLFYADGIHAVGIDRILATAGAAKASLYHHFGGKDDLVVAYLDQRSATFHESLHARLRDAHGTARTRITPIFDGIWQDAAGTAFHGCPFINAAAEYPSPEHPVRHAVTRHRERFATTLAGQLDRGGLAPQPSLVSALLLTYDGAMVTAQVASPEAAAAGTEQILDGLLGPVAGSR
ncbi:TetR/AcrR family transcriptional regulator [Isoptericola halotolerans]|uniref:TetR/AcrR family transcriptional regulator n=1 Tax=Isoptericola halotolerans TaxID=300560 RepID=UPI00388E5445